MDSYCKLLYLGVRSKVSVLFYPWLGCLAYHLLIEDSGLLGDYGRVDVQNLNTPSLVLFFMWFSLCLQVWLSHMLSGSSGQVAVSHHSTGVWSQSRRLSQKCENHLVPLSSSKHKPPSKITCLWSLFSTFRRYVLYSFWNL